MSEQNEEEARRRKIIIDGEVAGLAVRNIGPTMSGALSLEQVERMIAIDERWLSETRACMTDGAEPDSPATV